MVQHCHSYLSYNYVPPTNISTFFSYVPCHISRFVDIHQEQIVLIIESIHRIRFRGLGYIKLNL